MNFPPDRSGPVAQDHAHVDQQIGVNFGETTFHNNGTYYVNQEDPPERKFKVALNHLRGGTARAAESIFADLLRNGHASTRIAYYYALSVFSERSLNEMGDEMYSRYRDANRTAARFPDDEWRTALAVVADLLSCVWRQESGEVLDQTALTKAIDNFNALPAGRRIEIIRHLDMMLGGAIQDHLDVVEAQRVAKARLDGGRAKRAWKFFEPTPAKPRALGVAPVNVPTATWARIWLGVAAFVIAVIVALSSIGSGNTALGLVALVVFGAGFGGALRSGLDRELRARKLAWLDAEHGYTLQRQAMVSPGHWVSTDFVRQIHEQVDARFSEARPHVEGQWPAATEGVREYLKWRFLTLYGNAQVQAPMVNWLIRWHAKRVADGWLAGTRFGYRAGLLPSSRTAALFRLGFAAAVAGFVGMATSQAGYVGAAVFAAVGAFLVWRPVVQVYAARQLHGEQEAAGRRLFAEEQQGYDAWLAVLADRPTDAEMAVWLDLDKSHLKTSALRWASLANRDVVAHVVLTEGDPSALRAREAGGPMRYSKYVVLVFLLTRSGVREIEVDLDFLTANTLDERRTSFRYDALASARVSEVGVRYADNKRYIVRTDDTAAHLDKHTLRKRAFRLRLLDGDDISVVVETYRRQVDVTEQEDAARLNSVALEASGIVGALHVLEAVAAEGRDWIAREQERRRRRSEDWRRASGPRLLADGLRDPFGEDGPEAGPEVPEPR
ncbi:hypothetical protein AB0F91_02675 [Amycolatopsis sp. NPDC023774]|uniref:hypothetical protein n=1 Tax=Amycolatopsis sp. NPDC023774 TaxID=3155015 RepID=UPI0033FAFC9F